MTDITELAQSLKAAAEKATPGRIGDRIDGSGSIKYECFGYDGSLVLRTDHKNMEYGFIGDNSLADEEFFRACVPDTIIALVEALEKAQAENTAGVAGMAEGYETTISMLRSRIAELEQQNSIANEKVTELSRLVQHNISRAEDAERRAERISKSSSLSHPGLLHATNELVLIFSHALADKLYAAQEKYNHGTSWRNNDWQEACQRDFQKHIAKGDPRDVAAYCAFMWWHGWSTKPAEGLESRTVTVMLPDYRNTYKGPFADEVEHQVRLALELFSSAA
ncbi:TPA: ead/Ea22-like family protein, partial [Klebsiella pneumoniae]|nr:ead/Ea22-like family protein [Klebsiella pneumoniae]